VGYQLRQGHSTQAEAEPLPEPSFVPSAHPSYAIVQPQTVSASIPDDSNDTSLIPTRSVSTPSSTRHPRRDNCALRRQSTDHNTPCLISQRDREWQTETMILEGHTDSLCSVAFSLNGLRIVSGSDDHTVRIWDAVSGVVLHTLEGHTNPVYSVAFSSDGLRIVSGSEDRTVRIWDAVSGVVLHTLKGYDPQNNLRPFLAESPLTKGLYSSL
jgi:WD40 repeat protein